MKSKQLIFFALLEDIEKIFRNVDDLKYYLTGLHDNENIPTYNSIFDVPNIGVVFSGDWNRIDNYLIMRKSTLLNIRDVPQRTGLKKFAVDQMINKKSIDMKFGGIYQENIIVAGRISTISDDVDSNDLYKLFAANIRREFKKIGTSYVGSKAEEKLKMGWRLVTNAKSPIQYDLILM